MKKVTLALMILLGLTGLTGCDLFDDDDDDSPPVTGEVAKFSSLAGTYSGTITNGTECNNNSIAGLPMTMKINPSDATTTTMTINGMQAEGHNLTGNDFQYSVPDAVLGGCGSAAKFSGSCQYSATSLSCNYTIDGTLASGNMQLNR